MSTTQVGSTITALDATDRLLIKRGKEIKPVSPADYNDYVSGKYKAQCAQLIDGASDIIVNPSGETNCGSITVTEAGTYLISYTAAVSVVKFGMPGMPVDDAFASMYLKVAGSTMAGVSLAYQPENSGNTTPDGIVVCSGMTVAALSANDKIEFYAKTVATMSPTIVFKDSSFISCVRVL